jgi:putative membrane protein
MKTMMMYKKIILAAVASGCATAALADGNLVANPQAGNGQPANQPGSMQTPMLKALTAQQFVDDAAIGGMKEVRLGKVALEQSQNAEVRNFANKMVADHTLANNKLRQLAAQEGLTCPATNTFAADDTNWRNPLVENPATLKGQGAYLLMTNGPDIADYQAFQHLKGLAGHEFDLAYARDMVTDHINAVNEFEAASRNLPDQALRKFAADTLPTLREHSQMAQRLENQLAGQTADIAQPGAPVTAKDGGM